MSDLSSATGRNRPSAEDIAWVGLWPVTLLLLAAILWLAPPLSHLYPGATYDFFGVFAAQARPEPLEATRWLLALAAPLLLAGLVCFGSAEPGRPRFDRAAIALQVIAIGLIVWAVAAQTNGPFFPVPPGYFSPLLLGVPIIVAGVVIGAIAIALTVAGRGPFERPERVGKGSRRWRIGAFVAALVLTAVWLLPGLVTDGTVAAAGRIPSGHIPVWADEYFAVVNGRTPLVDFVPQYVHLISLATAPVLAAFDMSLASLSVLMIALSVLAMIALYGALYLVTDRHPASTLVLYVPVLAFALFPWTRDGSHWEFAGNDYAFFPGRYLGPFLVCWMCAAAIRGRRPPIWLAFFAAGLTALNNIEFGTPCVVALAVALFLGSPRRSLRETARGLVAPAVIGLAAALILVCGLILLRSGELPDLGLLGYFSDLFGRQGFGLAPMPTLGLHIPMYLTFVAATLIAAVRHVRGRGDATLTAMLAYAGVFGLLTASYFAGRSLPWQLMLLFPGWGFAIALLTWTALPHLRVARGRGAGLSRSVLPAATVIVAFGVMVAAIVTVPLPWQQVERLSEAPAPDTEAAGVAFVAAHTDSGEPILLFGSGSDHRVAERAGADNVSPWNSALALFSEREVDRSFAALDQAQGTKVFANADVNTVLDLGPRGFRLLGADPTSGLQLWERRLQ